MTTTASATLNIVFELAPDNPQPVPMEFITPLLELGLSQTQSQGAYVYRWNAEKSRLELTMWSGLPPTIAGRFQVQLGGAKARWYLDMNTTTVLSHGAWADWRFEDFPEFLLHRFESVTSVPLLDRGELVGVANFCRRERGGSSPSHADFLRRLSVPLGTLLAGGLERDRLRAELEKVTQQLADRKLIDRAKGVLQARFAWTEEEAYLWLRRTSRSRRIALRDVAQEVIRASERQPGRTDAAA